MVKINILKIFGIRIAEGIVMKRILVTILFIFFISGISFAEVYKWVDEKGVVYFTDDITQVPEKYRSRAEKIGLPEEKGETKVEGELMPKRKEETYRDRLGRGEDYWKGRVEEWRKKLKELQDKLEILRGRYNELTEKFNDSKSTAERGNLRRERDQVKSEMDQCKIQIEEARDMLEKKIPEEADLYKAKPEWVKQ
jgi:chromosome segregation ATPase